MPNTVFLTSTKIQAKKIYAKDIGGKTYAKHIGKHMPKTLGQHMPKT
jgi:hypothetical protein